MPDPQYLTGFGAHHSTEAIPGALPIGRNSPQRPPFGLYTEQLSATAFTAPRAENRRSWLYRMRPSGEHGPYTAYKGAKHFAPGVSKDPLAPNRLRWSPMDEPKGKIDLIDSLVTMMASGDPADGEGVAIHLYAANADMARRAFMNADAETMFVPQQGSLKLSTEMGVLDLEPGFIGLVPRGVRFRAELPDGSARGYVGENHGELFRLPELGPLGSNGLANPRDFESPVASFEDIDEEFELIHKVRGSLWTTTLRHSPLDVVAWHGNLAPYRYELARFNTIGTVSYDHPDPSIFTALTSPSAIPGTANCDFVIFPPRWMVAEDTFRPPWFHRNLMSEAMGLIHGAYDAKAEGFAPGALSLHNIMTSHGPDLETWRAASAAELKPHRIEGTMAFMFESRRAFIPTEQALKSGALQADYDECWQGFPKAEVA